MGIRTHRIGKHELPPQTNDLPGKKVHVTLLSGETRFGQVQAQSAEGLTLVDVNAAWYNRKRHTHLLRYDEIREILWDEVRPW